VELTNGPGRGQTRRITDYDESSGEVTVFPAWDLQPGSNTTYKVLTELDNAMSVLDGVQSGGENSVEAQATGITVINDGASNKAGILTYKPNWAQEGWYRKNGHFLSCTVRVQGTMSSGKTGIAFGFRVPDSRGNLALRAEVMHDSGGTGDLICRLFAGTTFFADISLEAGADPTTLTNAIYQFHFHFDARTDKLVYFVQSLSATTQTLIAGPATTSPILSTALYRASNPLSDGPAGGYCFFGCSAAGPVVTAQFLQFHAGVAEEAHVLEGSTQGTSLALFNAGDFIFSAKENRQRGWSPSWPYSAGPQWVSSKGAWKFTKDSDAPQAWYRVEPALGYYAGRGFALHWEMELDDNVLDGDQTGFTISALVDDGGSQSIMRLAFLADVGDPLVGWYTAGPVQDADSYLTARINWRVRGKYTWTFVPEEDFCGLYFNGELIHAVRGASALSSIQTAPNVDAEPQFWVGMDSSAARSTAHLWGVRVDTETRHFSPERYNEVGTTLQTPSGTTPSWTEEVGAGSSSTVENEEAAYSDDLRVFWRASSRQTPVFAWRKLDAAASVGHREWTENRTLAVDMDFRVSTPPESSNLLSGAYWSGGGLAVGRGDGRLFFAAIETDKYGKGILVCKAGDGTTLAEQIHAEVEAFNRSPETGLVRFLSVDWSAWIRLRVWVPGLSTASGRVWVEAEGHLPRALDEEWLDNSIDFGGTGWSSGEEWVGMGVFANDIDTAMDVRKAYYSLEDGREIELAHNWDDSMLAKHSVEEESGGAWLTVYSEEA